MSDEDLKGELERLKAENEQPKSQRGRSVSLRVSEKGGVSVQAWDDSLSPVATDNSVRVASIEVTADLR